MTKNPEQFSENETARRRDEVNLPDGECLSATESYSSSKRKISG
jgi:hypothetical protein